MDSKDALHALALSHCKERYEYWSGVYRELLVSGRARVTIDEMNWRYTFEAYATFPRYLVLEAILAEIERCEARQASTVDSLREQLVAAGWRAQTTQTSDPGLPAAAFAAMGEEREAFARFVHSIAASQLEAAEPLE
jgi:hypothetical protein